MKDCRADCREFQFATLRTTPIARFSFRMQIQETRQFHRSRVFLMILIDQRESMSLVDLAATGCGVITLTAVFSRVSVGMPQFITVSPYA